jgi:hypothetical protein
LIVSDAQQMAIPGWTPAGCRVVWGWVGRRYSKLISFLTNFVRYSLGKKSVRFENDMFVKINAAKLSVNEILNVYEIWNELDQMKRMRPAATFSDQPFIIYKSMKMTSRFQTAHFLFPWL